MHALRPIGLVLVLSCAPSGLLAQQQVDERWQLDMDGAVRIHSYNGTVTVRGWDRDTVHVTGTVASRGKAAFFGGGRGKGVKMGVEGTDDKAPLADLTIFLPARARLSVRGAATTIDIRDFAGTIDATTLSGRIHIAGTPSEVMAETMDGDLEVTASPSFVRARTATGRVTWTGSSDDVTIVTVGGTIMMNAATIYHARVESIAGDIKFTGGVKLAGRVSFDTHGGDVTVVLSKETFANISASANEQREFMVERPGKGAAAAKGSGPRGVSTFTLPRRGSPAGVPAEITARSFKGMVSVTQP